MLPVIIPYPVLFNKLFKLTGLSGKDFQELSLVDEALHLVIHTDPVSRIDIHLIV